MGALLFWDLRAGEVVQTLQLQSQETSYITSLNGNSIIFGDGREIGRCDLRKMRRERQCDEGMKVSAETILIT